MFTDGAGMKFPRKSRLIMLLLVAGALLTLWPMRSRVAAYAVSAIRHLMGVKTMSVDERLAQFGEAARSRWKPHFDRAGVNYPPKRVTLLGLKDRAQLEVYATLEGGQWVYVRSIKVLAASGELGPKLREGDYQVPEGIYAVESLNPNSAFHVSLRVGYPNAFDRAKGRMESRQNLGGEIMIHGGAASVGCLAVGNVAAEDLFVLAADTKIENMTIVLSPIDLRLSTVSQSGHNWPTWYPELLAQLEENLAKLPKPDMESHP